MRKKKQPQRQKHVPQRTCIVCREKRDKRNLTRIVRTPDEGIVVDPTGKRNGRGAYLCAQPSCWDKALSRPSIIIQALRAEMLTEEEKALILAHKPHELH